METRSKRNDSKANMPEAALSAAKAPDDEESDDTSKGNKPEDVKGNDSDGLFEDTDREENGEKENNGNDEEESESESEDDDDEEDDGASTESEASVENESNINPFKRNKSYFDRIKALEIMLKKHKAEMKEYKKKARTQQATDNRMIRKLVGRIRTAQTKINEKTERIKSLPSELKSKFEHQQDHANQATKRKMDSITEKLETARQEIKRLKRYETQAVLVREKAEELKTEIARLKMSYCEKHRETTRLKRSIATLEQKVAKFNEKKFSAMEACSERKLEQNRVVLERRRLELVLKDKEVANKKIVMDRQALIRNRNRASDQLIKDASVARKAHQNHCYAVEYCKMQNSTPKKTKVNSGTFPKVNEDLSQDTPHLGEAYQFLMNKKTEEAMAEVEAAQKELKELNKSIARADKFPAIKNQPSLDSFVTPKRKALPPVVPDVPVVTTDHPSQMREKMPSAYPGWNLVMDGFSKDFFYEHEETGKCIFSTTQIDPNGISPDENKGTIEIIDDDANNERKMTPEEKKKMNKSNNEK